MSICCTRSVPAICRRHQERSKCFRTRSCVRATAYRRTRSCPCLACSRSLLCDRHFWCAVSDVGRCDLDDSSARSHHRCCCCHFPTWRWWCIQQVRHTMKPKHCTRATVIATFLLLVILFLELLSLLRILLVVGCYSMSILSMLTITLSRLLLLYMGRQDGEENNRKFTNAREM